MSGLGKAMFVRFASVLLAVCLIAVTFGTSAQARFVSPDDWDPTIPGVGTNRYSYAFNDPVNQSDPNGHILPAIIAGIAACSGGGCEFIVGTTLGLLGWVAADKADDGEVNGSLVNKSAVSGHNNPPADNNGPQDPDPRAVAVAVAIAGVTVYNYNMVLDRVSELGARPANKKGVPGFNEWEAQNGYHLEQKLGVRLERTQEERDGDFRDPKTGVTYDALGPSPSEHFDFSQYKDSFNAHLNKSVDKISVDVTGYTDAQKSQVRSLIDSVPQSQRDRIVELGF